MYRAYFFGNMYLSPIQQGIQALHVVGDMSIKYPYNHSCKETNDYMNWADNYKTVVLLNGGMESDLKDIVSFFDNQDNPFSWDYFEESQDALNGALTSVGIILPERIYVNAKTMRSNDDLGYLDTQGVSEWEQKLYAVLNSCRLA